MSEAFRADLPVIVAPIMGDQPPTAIAVQQQSLGLEMKAWSFCMRHKGYLYNDWNSPHHTPACPNDLNGKELSTSVKLFVREMGNFNKNVATFKKEFLNMSPDIRFSFPD